MFIRFNLHEYYRPEVDPVPTISDLLDFNERRRSQTYTKETEILPEDAPFVLATSLELMETMPMFEEGRRRGIRRLTFNNKNRSKIRFVNFRDF